MMIVYYNDISFDKEKYRTFNVCMCKPSIHFSRSFYDYEIVASLCHI